MANLCTEADVRKYCESAVRSSMAERLADGAPYLVGDADDDELGLIVLWSQLVEKALGRTVAQTTSTIKVDGQGTSRLIVPAKFTPIISITSISYPLSGELTSTSYEFSANAGIIYLVGITSEGVPMSETAGRFSGPSWPRGRRNITIVLVHGWAVVPNAIRTAVARACAVDVLVEDAGGRDKGVLSKRLGDRSETYGDGRHDNLISRHQEFYAQTLQRYRAGVATAGGYSV